MVGSEVFSSEVKKTEVLMENFRRAIGESAGGGWVLVGGVWRVLVVWLGLGRCAREVAGAAS